MRARRIPATVEGLMTASVEDIDKAIQYIDYDDIARPNPDPFGELFRDYVEKSAGVELVFHEYMGAEVGNDGDDWELHYHLAENRETNITIMLLREWWPSARLFLYANGSDYDYEDHNITEMPARIKQFVKEI